jgi:Spy/CpxP family protein refolding chaperone
MSDSRVRIWFSLFVLAVFCVGLAGGVLIGRRLPIDRVAERGFRRPPDGPGPGPLGPGRGGPMRGLLLERLGRDLDLTADQRTQIDAVLTSRRTRLEELRRDVNERFDAEQRELLDEIRKVLTPEQREKFERREKELRGRFRRPPPSR